MVAAGAVQVVPFKGTASRDFLPQLFFHEPSSPKRLKIKLGPFQFFQIFSEKFASQGAPSVSTTPAVNLAAGTAGVVDTGGK